MNFAGTDGGSAGGYSRKTILAATIGATQTVTIGTGGTYTAGIYSGSEVVGGTTSFGSLLQATGGSSSTPGVGSNGDFNTYGGQGTFGLNASGGSGSHQIQAGNGGNSLLGGSPSGYGSGGNGVVNTSGNQQTINGNSGISGIIIVTEYYS